MLRRSSVALRTLVTFVRHSESTNNVLYADIGADRRSFDLQRHPDAPLTERGLAQAERVAERIALENGRDASLIVTSYFHRALKTAEAVEAALRKMVPDSPAKVVVDRDFHEIGGLYRVTPCANGITPENPLGLDVRGIPGRTSWDVMDEFPTFHAVRGQNCERGWYMLPGKEDLETARRRAFNLWARIADYGDRLTRLADAPEDVDASLVVITHGYLYSVMMNEAKLAGLFDGPTPEEFTRLTNTAVTRVVLDRPVSDLEQPLQQQGKARRAQGIAEVPTLRAADVTIEGAGRLPRIQVVLDNCNQHVADIGSLVSSTQPLR